MEVTTLSTKGQIVIPESMRKNLAIGTSFSVAKVDNLIVLRPVDGLTADEQKELKEINKLWKEVDSGKAKSYSMDQFLAKMKQW